MPSLVGSEMCIRDRVDILSSSDVRELLSVDEFVVVVVVVVVVVAEAVVVVAAVLFVELATRKRKSCEFNM